MNISVVGFTLDLVTVEGSFKGKTRKDKKEQFGKKD